MNPIGSNSTAAQTYGGVQRGGAGNGNDISRVVAGSVRAPNALSSQDTGAAGLPRNATPRGDWVLAENAPAQSFDQASPRGTYLNVVV